PVRMTQSGAIVTEWTTTTTSLAFACRCSIDKVFVGATACWQSGPLSAGSLGGASFCPGAAGCPGVGLSVFSGFGVQQEFSLLVVGQQLVPQQQEEGAVCSD